jgi:hypothetical protein
MLPADSTIADWLRKLEQGDDINQCASGDGRSPDDHINALITSDLEEYPFHSVRTARSAIKHPRTTVCPFSTVVSVSEWI